MMSIFFSVYRQDRERFAAQTQPLSFDLPASSERKSGVVKIINKLQLENDPVLDEPCLRLSIKYTPRSFILPVVFRIRV